MNCEVLRRNGGYIITCNEWRWTAKNLSPDEACDPHRIASAVGIDLAKLDVASATLLGNLVAACKEAVTSYIPGLDHVDPGYGIPTQTFVVERRLANIANTKVIIYQGGYYVELPSEYAKYTKYLRNKEAIIRIDNTEVTMTDFLRRLGIDPNRKYHIITINGKLTHIYDIGNQELLATDILLAGGKVELFVHGRTPLSTVVRDPLVLKRIARGLGISKKDLEEGNVELYVVHAYRYPPLKYVEPMIDTILGALDEFMDLPIDDKLKLVYLGESLGGHLRHAVPHAIVGTPPNTGKTLLAENLFYDVFSSASEASILGGANVRGGSVFESVFDGLHSPVQIEHLEGLKRTLIQELLTVMAGGRSSRAVLGTKITTVIYTPFVFTANTRRSKSVSEAFIELVSILATNTTAVGRRFAVVLFDPSIARYHPSSEDKQVLARVGLVKYLVNHPVLHDKLARLYTLILDRYGDEYTYRLRVQCAGPLTKEFLTSFVEEHHARATHLALNIAALYRLREVWEDTVTPRDLHLDALDWYRDLESKVVQPSIEYIIGVRDVDTETVLAGLPKYVRQAIIDMLKLVKERAKSGEQPIARFSEVYNRNTYARTTRKRVVAMITRYILEIEDVLDRIGASIRVLDDENDVEISLTPER